ncbi:MAG: hypothetical protein WC459_03020 [Patescibacteria group bacterium]
MIKKKAILCVIVLLAVAGGAFYGGMVFAKSKRGSGFPKFSEGDFQSGFVQSGRPTGSGTARGGNFTNGEIMSKDQTSLTLKMGENGTKIIFYTDKTPVTKTVSGTLEDLKTGEQIMVTGTANQDGSITAGSIQIRPADAFAPVKISN